MAIQVHLIERIYLYLSVKLNCKWMDSLLGFMFGKLKENFEAKLTDWPQKHEHIRVVLFYLA